MKLAAQAQQADRLSSGEVEALRFLLQGSRPFFFGAGGIVSDVVEEFRLTPKLESCNHSSAPPEPRSGRGGGSS